MKKLLLLMAGIFTLAIACKKKEAGDPANPRTVNGVKQITQTANGITFRSFVKPDQATYKGILVMGSGNNENNPSEGAIYGAPETALCQKAAENGYAAAIVQYGKTPGTANWNESAKILGEDFDKCIVAMADLYKVDKNKSVVGSFSYASYALLTNIAYFENLKYCKGLLAACGSTDIDKITKFKIPVMSLTSSNEYEAYTDPVNPQNNAYVGIGLYNKIPANSPIKAKSEGFDDPDSNTHCGGNWTDKMYTKMVAWLN